VKRLGAADDRDGTTGVRIAAGFAGLLVVAGIVLQASVGLTVASSEAERLVGGRANTIALSTDAPPAAPLFDEVELTAGDPVDACIQVRSHGPVADDALGLHLTGYRGDIDLARALRIEVAQHRGQPGSTDGTCQGFDPGSVLLHGSVDQLSRDHGDRPYRVRGEAHGATSWYRVRVVLPADALVVGRIDDLGLAWTSEALADTPGRREKLVAVAAAVAENSAVPLLGMLVLSVLFVGIQHRIDAADPKLALAPVRHDELEFE
jgi:hypothetical protein